MTRQALVSLQGADLEFATAGFVCYEGAANRDGDLVPALVL